MTTAFINYMLRSPDGKTCATASLRVAHPAHDHYSCEECDHELSEGDALFIVLGSLFCSLDCARAYLWGESC